MVRAKEEGTRLTKRIRQGEKELAELEGKARVVQERVETLHKEQKGIDKCACVCLCVCVVCVLCVCVLCVSALESKACVW
jgi:hypothetical protein